MATCLRLSAENRKVSSDLGYSAGPRLHLETDHKVPRQDGGMELILTSGLEEAIHSQIYSGWARRPREEVCSGSTMALAPVLGTFSWGVPAECSPPSTVEMEALCHPQQALKEDSTDLSRP